MRVEEEYSLRGMALRLMGHGDRPPVGLQYPSFPLLDSPEDMAMLVRLRFEARSKESREKLGKLVDDKAREAATRLKKWLGVKRGRPRDFSKRQRWREAAKLRKEDPRRYTWGKLARLDPDYDRDPQGAGDRIRHGVEAILKRRVPKR